MSASKIIGDWAFWAFRYGAACVPAAFFGGIVASSFVYNYDRSHRLTHYMAALYAWEWVAAVACAAPGFVWVLWTHMRSQQEEREELQSRRQAGAADVTVWPPSPDN